MSDKKVVFITGASRGIGAACVEKFINEGWRVAGFFRETGREGNENVRYYQMEVAKEEDVEKAFSQALADFGRVDGLVNCAGIFGFKHLEDYDVASMKRVMEVNELGTYVCTKWMVGRMKEGVIINVSSSAGEVGSGTDPVYAGTKAAVVAFTKSMAKALAPRIRVNAIAPGIVQTDMADKREWQDVAELLENTPLKKMALPTDIANGIYFLASEQAGHITGACLDVNGGLVMR